MDENFEDNNANDNLLSQSYFDGIQKVTGNDRASLLDFQIPADVLEKRKSDWNAFFEKYASKSYEEEEKLESPEHKKEEEYTTNNQQINIRYPMRKPMSMVQYWVNTGNQPYATNNLEKSQSEAGCSLAEECLEEIKSMNSPDQIINNSLEKNHAANDTSRNEHLRLASSSASSVDTVAYILANNNTTKKADTIAIMEGSKIVNKEPLQSSVAINDTEKINHSKKNVSFSDNMLHNLNSTELDISISNNISKNVETDINVNKSHQINSPNQEGNSNDSDESIFRSKYGFHIFSQNSVVENNENVDIEKILSTSIIENKTFKRKKLYNNSESLAEFTPVSEDNISHLALKMPVKKCEHPALETPRISSRPSYLVRYQRLKSRSKRKSRISHSFKMLKTQKNGKDNNSQNLVQGNSQVINEKEKNYEQNLKKTLDSSNNIKIQDHCNKPSNLLNKNLLNNFKEKAFNLKPLVISLQRLPYKYDFIETRLPKKQQLDSSQLNKSDKKINSIKNNSQSSPSKQSYALEAKIDNFKSVINGVSLNSSNNSEDDKVDSKLSPTKTVGLSSQIQKSYSKKSMNYIIAFSSDDETELSITNLKQTLRKLSEETSQIKNTLDVINCSEKKLVGSNLRVDKSDSKISIPDSNKLKNEKKIHDFKRKSLKVTKLEQSEKNKMTDISQKKLLSENKSCSKIFSFSKQMDKKLLLMSSDEETVISQQKNCSESTKLLKKRKGNLSPSNNKKFDQTSSNVLSVNENQKSPLNEEKTVHGIVASETKSLLLKQNKTVKNFRYSQNTSSSSDEDIYLPVKSNYEHKSKLISSAVKDNIAKSLSRTEETVTNLIGDLSVNSLLLRKNEEKVNHLEERINKIKMKNQNTLLNSDNNHLKTISQMHLQMDSSEEENFIGNKSLVKVVKSKSWQNKKKRPLKEHSEMAYDKSKNKKDSEKSKKEYLSSKKAKRKSEMFMSSDEECIIPLKIKFT